MPISNQESGIKPGTVAHFAASAAPVGWVKANGAAVSRTVYAALFLSIGTAYGAGDGSTTFNVPDLRGEFLRGWDDSRGVDTGRAFGSAQSDAMQGHKHIFEALAWSGGASIGPYGTGSGSLLQDPYVGLMSVGLPKTDGTNGATRTAGETRSRNIAMLACIKY